MGLGRRRYTLRECTQIANLYQQQARAWISDIRNAHEYGFEAPTRALTEMHLARLESKRFRRMAKMRALFKAIAEEAGLRVLYEI